MNGKKLISKNQRITVPKAQWNKPPNREDSFTLFSCCDTGYFEQYAESFIYSTERYSPGHSIHLHIVNPTEENIETLESWRKQLENTSLTYSIEELDLPFSESDFCRTYYASIRFVRAAEFIQQCEIACFIVDIDAIVINKLIGVTKATANADIGVRTRFHREEDYLKIAAGAVYVAPTKIGLKFINNVAKHIRRSLENWNGKNSPWYADQYALYDAYKATKNKATLVELSKKLCDWEFKSDSIIWTAKGDRKEDEKFNKAAKAIKNNQEFPFNEPKDFNLPSVSWRGLDIQKQTLVLFTTCDTEYFNLFGEVFLTSINTYSPGCSVHLHLINPETSTIEKLEKLRHRLHHTTITTTWEVADFTSYPRGFAKNYYSAIRFIRAQEFIERFNTNCLIIDIDTLVIKNLQPLKSLHKKCNISLRTCDYLEEENQKVSGNSIYITATPSGANFLKEVNALILPTISRWDGTKHPRQRTDQHALHLALKDNQDKYQYLPLSKKYCDWRFQPDSFIWTAKSAQKHSANYHQLIDKVKNGIDITPTKASANETTVDTKRWLIVLPQLNIQWKKPTEGQEPKAVQPGSSTEELRAFWREFAEKFYRTLITLNQQVELVEIPAWEITREWIDSQDYDCALIPHNTLTTFGEGRVRCYFYMQVFCQWLFTIDPMGWSAGASSYPYTMTTAKPIQHEVFTTYQEKLLSHNNSKFSQPEKNSRAELILAGLIPVEPFIFFPCQIPHDESIIHFSDIDEVELLQNLIFWCEENRIPLVLKPHPVNQKSMRPIAEIAKGDFVYYSEASVHDLIDNARVVYTINSGVGFESMLHKKPVVTFGRVDYDVATIRGDASNFDKTWNRVISDSTERRVDLYKRFLSSFTTEHAVDLRHNKNVEQQINLIAQTFCLSQQTTQNSQ